MNLVKYFVDGSKMGPLCDTTSLYELKTDKGIYYLSISSDSYAIGINLYDESLENEVKTYYEENEFNQLEDLEAGLYDFDIELEELFKIKEIKEVNNQEIFDKWSSNWM